MTRGWWAKLALLVGFIVTSVIYVVPTFFKLDTEKTKWPYKKVMNLGLDLQGGLYLVMGVDFNRVFRDVLDRQAKSFQATAKDKGMAFTKAELLATGEFLEDPRVKLEFDAKNRDALYEMMKRDYWTLRLVGDEAGKWEIGLSREFRGEVRDRTLQQSIEVIRNRIDEFGVAEPSITSQGSDRIVVELPGVKEVQRAKDLIGRTARLEFKLVNDDAMSPAQVAELVAKIEKDKGIKYKEGEKFSNYVQALNDAAKGQLPANHEIAFERLAAYELAENETQARFLPYLLNTKADVTGEDLEDAQVQIDQENQRPVVAFSLNPRGADAFDKVTAAHEKKRFAIVLDNIVVSAPIIQNRISGGRAQITLGQGEGDKVMKEAKDLAIVLRAGALPAQLDFLEERVVGPSLGADSVQNGAKAALVGIIAVLIFVSLYYRVSGLVAAASLVLNLLFSMAILIGIDATLTLPGIAGLALTIGMAVDSNVLIFERIRDELREGKSIAGAVDAGFQKAFSAIFDANITHGIIGTILIIWGTGPIRGFAMTLLIGIFTTLFCAVTVCKLIFDGWLAVRDGDPKSISV
jgi:preprotein translocase subunit SecD